MKLIVQEPFKWAHQGVRVEEFAVGAEIETEDQDLIDVSTGEGWAALEGAEQPAGDGGEQPATPRRGARAK